MFTTKLVSYTTMSAPKCHSEFIFACIWLTLKFFRARVSSEPVLLRVRATEYGISNNYMYRQKNWE